MLYPTELRAHLGFLRVRVDFGLGMVKGKGNGAETSGTVGHNPVTIKDTAMIALSLLSAAAVLCASPQVHDGDSLRCGAERIRIANIDAPELDGSPKCARRPLPRSAWCDPAAGEAARRALAALLARSQRVTIRRIGTDSYGRTLALVYVDGIDAGEWLIKQGLARRWR